MSAQQQQPSASFWLSDALSVLGSYAGAYANNRLTYESAKDEIELNNLRMRGYMNAAQVAAGAQGNTGIPQQVAGVPTGLLAVLAIAAVAAVIWAAKA